MNRQLARLDIVTAVQNAAIAWTDYPCVVDYENRDHIDYSAQVNPYAALDIVYLDGRQMDLGQNPLVRVYGQILLAVCVQEGKGTAGANMLSDHFTKALQFQRWLTVETQVAKPQPNVYKKGWCCLTTIVPFEYQSKI